MLVFLDTNVYIATRYVYDKQRFALLLNLMDRGKVNVIYTSATKGEVLQHIEADVDKAVKAYNSVLKKDAAYLLAQEDFNLDKFDSTVTIEHIKKKFMDFLSRDEVHCISMNPVDAEVLMQDYFEGNPPFEEKKPYEFKDALIINAIKQFRKTIDMDVCVVSQDIGFRKAFEHNAGFIVFERISDFLNYHQQQEEKYTEIEQFLQEEIADGVFEDTILEYLSDFDINRAYYGEWECEDQVIKEIECELSCADITENGALAYIDATVYLEVQIKHRNEDESYYDKEEHRYLFEKYVTAIEKHRVPVEITIECAIERDEEDKLCITDHDLIADEKFLTFNLDEDTMQDYEEIDETSESDPNTDLEYCYECGRLIGKSSDIAGFTYDGHALCDSCMTGSAGYEICPHCGRKVPSEFMMSGFCEQCAREME